MVREMEWERAIECNIKMSTKTILFLPDFGQRLWKFQTRTVKLSSCSEQRNRVKPPGACGLGEFCMNYDDIRFRHLNVCNSCQDWLQVSIECRILFCL